MSSDGGLTWKFTTASPNPGGLSVDDGQSLQVGASFGGLNIIFLITALSADPSGAHVYAAYGKRDADNVDRIYLAEFHPDPSNPGTLVERANPVPLSVPGQRGALPSVAVTESGRVFVMYDTFDGTQFHVHLATSADQGLTFADQPLYDFAGLNVGSPGPRQRILGDYQSLIAVDDTVYGSFAGRGNVNDPVTGINTTDMIDPFFFSVPAPDTGHAHLRRSHPAGPPFVDTVPPNPGPLPEDLDGTALAAADAGGAPAPASSAVSEEGTAPPFAGLGRDVTGRLSWRLWTLRQWLGCLQPLPGRTIAEPSSRRHRGRWDQQMPNGRTCSGKTHGWRGRSPSVAAFCQPYTNSDRVGG
jgi:hypothetical protein